MNFHWSITHLIVGTIALAMLSLNPALASPHYELVNKTLPPPECPPDCPRPHYFLNIGSRTAIQDANQATVKQQPLSSTQIYTQAIAVNNTYGETGYDGTALAIKRLVAQYATQIKAVNLSVAKAYPYLVASGYKGTQAQLQAWVNQSTATDRQAAVNDVLYGNLLYRMLQYANYMNTVSSETGLLRQHPDLMNASWRLRRVYKVDPDTCAGLTWIARGFIIIGLGVVTFATGGTALAVFGSYLLFGGTVWEEGIAPLECEP